MRKKNLQIDIEKLENILPHGSGINCDWEFTEYKNKAVKCINYWHYMDENGFYDGFYKFSFNVSQIDSGYYFENLRFPESKRVGLWGMVEYISETVHYALSNEG
jgi:hypothetical protein